MKQTLLAIALCVSLGALADEVPLYYDEFTQNMGVVSLVTNGENAPKSGKIDFWMSLDDVAFNELPSVTAMKFLAE